MIRGGGVYRFDNGAWYYRSANRNNVGRDPDVRDCGVGFRVVLAPGQP